MSTSMSKPNRRAECENGMDLFFFKQWNWGGLPAATKTALRTSVCCLLESLLLPNTNTAASSVSAWEGPQLSLGTSGYNISSARKFLPSHALDVQPTNQELEISHKTMLEYGKSQRGIQQHTYNKCIYKISIKELEMQQLCPRRSKSHCRPPMSFCTNSKPHNQPGHVEKPTPTCTQVLLLVGWFGHTSNGLDPKVPKGAQLLWLEGT